MTCHDEDCRSARLWAAERIALDAARIAALEADSDEAFARWYFIDCQGHDLGLAQKWLARFRERRDDG